VNGRDSPSRCKGLWTSPNSPPGTGHKLAEVLLAVLFSATATAARLSTTVARHSREAARRRRDRELMSLLAGRVIHQGDQLRWLPAAGDTAAARKAFEIIGWDDGRELRPVPMRPQRPCKTSPSTRQALAS